MSAADGPTVVVVGGSMAGLLAARALSPHAASVTVLERDRLSEEVGPRGHVPQGRHLHLLLAAGLDLLRDWFPGIEDDLMARGAVPVDGHRAWVYQGGAYRARGDWGRPVVCLTRPLLEHVVRQRVADLPGVTIETGVVVQRVALDGHRVTGVVVDDVERPADLVVDCSGRSSRIALDLVSSGLLVPPVTRVGIDIGYSSFFMRRGPDDLEGDFVVCIDSPGTFRAASALPVEAGRWQVTLAGVHGDVPPTDAAGIRAFAQTLPSPTVGQLIERCERLSPVAAYRFPSSQRRHYERSPLLPGLVTVGDAASSFDPIYGQGMTSAALQAAALEEAARTLGVLSPQLPTRFHRKAARIIDNPWRIAVGGDFTHPATTGPRPLGTAQLNGYVRRVVQAAHASLPVARSFNRVLQLSDPPMVLLRPDTVVRVMRHARRSPAVTGTAVVHPRVGTDILD